MKLWILPEGDPATNEDLGTRTLLGAPGIATRSKKLLVTRSFLGNRFTSSQERAALYATTSKDVQKPGAFCGVARGHYPFSMLFTRGARSSLIYHFLGFPRGKNRLAQCR